MGDLEEGELYSIEWNDGEFVTNCMFDREHRGFLIFIDESKLYLSISLVALIFLPFCILALFICLKPFRESVDNANNIATTKKSISAF